MREQYRSCCEDQSPKKRDDEYNTIFCDSCYSILKYDKVKKKEKAEAGEKKEKKKKIDDKGHVKLDRETLKQEADIKKMFAVRVVDTKDTREWIEKKHYSRRMPNVKHALGLFDTSGKMQGVCTFSMPVTHYYNEGGTVFGGKVQVELLELNRLVINDDLPKNTLSFFVSRALDLLPKPICVVSYADLNNNHHGYIYQATNWIYTGLSDPIQMFRDKKNGRIYHNITIRKKYKKQTDIPDHIEEIKEEGGKHRYFKLLGDKKHQRIMQDNFVYQGLPYPKGENKRYDSSYKVKGTQMQLFDSL